MSPNDIYESWINNHKSIEIQTDFSQSVMKKIYQRSQRKKININRVFSVLEILVANIYTRAAMIISAIILALIRFGLVLNSMIST